ncbi:MAG: DUF2179 domain-containing protein [Bdellovibrionales bacterium]|nr:DUF2179 domain-containing protein [Bdellovibrionales bacterium]
MDHLALALLIVLARVGDVSLGTLRTIFVVKGKRGEAVITGFFEALLWVVAVGKVATNLDQPILVVAYATGYAVGNFVGLTIEKKLAMGNQVLRVFTRKSGDLLTLLRDREHRVTKFTGEGRESAIDMLLMKAKRRHVSEIVSLVREHDQEAFFFIDDIGETSERAEPFLSPFGWMGRVKKK